MQTASSRAVLWFVVAAISGEPVNGCARSVDRDRVAGTHLAPTPRSQGDVLTADEIARSIGVTTAMDAVKLLRPLFLHREAKLNATDKGEIAVYVNASHVGGVDALSTIPISAVREIRFLRQAEARLLLGLNVNGVVIQVVTWSG
jgi:hypothetical protein